MNLIMGSQVFRDVQIPLLWGERAVVQDARGRLSVLDLSGESARLEVLADEPAPGVRFRPSVGGIVILQDGVELYTYNPREKTLSGSNLELPEVQISAAGTRIGTNWFSGNVVEGSGVGIAITRDGFAVGAPLPAKLARLKLQATPVG
jgi:hypothetical protein